MPPERLITPTPFGTPGLNHCRALSARPPIMPTTPLPGLNAPSVFGPRNIAPFAFAAAAISIASHTGTRSGTKTVSLIPPSIAETAASFTPAAGTKTTEMSISPNEYSSMSFAMFFLAEYINMVTVSAVATDLFLGGWHGPFLPESLGWIWFLLKVGAILFFYVWMRWTLPRYRYDQLMAFGWKFLLPVAVINLLVTATGVLYFALP